jgi:hypothetical protein
MRVVFRSKDFNSVLAGGFGFNNRRPMASTWQYQGRVQHSNWQGTFECHWDDGKDSEQEGEKRRRTYSRNAPELVWTVTGDARLFGLAAMLKAHGFVVEVLQDEDAQNTENTM